MEESGKKVKLSQNLFQVLVGMETRVELPQRAHTRCGTEGTLTTGALFHSPCPQCWHGLGQKLGEDSGTRTLRGQRGWDGSWIWYERCELA